MIEIFWIHAKMYFPCKVISWTPLRATRRSTTLNSRSSLWRLPTIVLNKSPSSTTSATKMSTRRRQLSQGEGNTKETLAAIQRKHTTKRSRPAAGMASRKYEAVQPTTNDTTTRSMVLALRLGTTPTINPQESSSPFAASSVGAPAPAKRVFTQGDQASGHQNPVPCNTITIYVKLVINWW
jgi:hypothetical protein